MWLCSTRARGARWTTTTQVVEEFSGLPLLVSRSKSQVGLLTTLSVESRLPGRTIGRTSGWRTLRRRRSRRFGRMGEVATNKKREVRVGVLMGSDTDLPVMSEAGKVLDKFGIGYEMEVMSAHRTPVRAHEYATTAQSRGLKVLIAAAGAAAHLAGVIAANTTLPVIGVPMGTSSLNGLDALLSTVQMPGGIPVATMAIDKAGAVNAAIFAAEILGLSDPDIARKLVKHKEELAQSVTEKNARLQQQLAQRK